MLLKEQCTGDKKKTREMMEAAALQMADSGLLENYFGDL